jgi:hypothetical protein
MDVYRRKIAGNQHDDITIYTKDEADRRGMEYRHWREAAIGTWAITDDDYVGFYYGRYDFPQRPDDARRGRSRFVSYFGFGNLMSTRAKPYYYETRRATGRFSSDKTWSEALASLRISKMCVKIYVKTLLADGAVNWPMLGRILGKNDLKPEWKAKRIFKTKEFRKMVEDELDKVLSEKHIDKGMVLDIYQRAIALAEKNEDPGNMIKAAKDLGELVGLAPKNVTHTETWELTDGSARKLEDHFKSSEASILKLTPHKEVDPSDETSIDPPTRTDDAA